MSLDLSMFHMRLALFSISSIVDSGRLLTGPCPHQASERVTPLRDAFNTIEGQARRRAPAASLWSSTLTQFDTVRSVVLTSTCDCESAS
eukprot:333027-Pleurochrysis_carterae.AAC.2